MRKEISEGDNKTLPAAAKAHIEANAQIILSGHHHVFEAMKYASDLPLQIVSGHGGDDLSVDAPNPMIGLEINGEKVIAGQSRPGVFGFSMIERDPNDMTGANWTLTGYDIRGMSIGHCVIAGRNLACD